VVSVDGSGAKFFMESGTITGNTNSDNGGGVVVKNGGTFEMDGGTISGNASHDGGGVQIGSDSTTIRTVFTMNGGTISGNYAGDGGGGVQVGTEFSLTGERVFIMNGGTISGNSADDSGGGVMVGRSGGVEYDRAGGEFTMNGGTISGNSDDGNDGGGGVYVDHKAAFTLENGTISGNSTGGGGGGGVYVRNDGTFTMKGGIISGNIATSNIYGYGGGVIKLSGSGSTGIFIKTGGTIYGANAGEKNSNRAQADGMGHAVCVLDVEGEEGEEEVTVQYYRDTTSGPGSEDNINTSNGTGLLPGPGL
jgi:hypothetical protein